jgi:streptogramin lyase
VALIRIADKKPVFYAYAGGNPHSAELLPDGNIVCASSTGNYLTLFKVDTTVGPDNVKEWQLPIAFGHNVVWDKKRKLLWSAAMDHMLSYRYNNNCDEPRLTLQDSIAIPGNDAHDLFPDFNKDQLWLTNTTNVYRFDVATKKVLPTDLPQKNIKSVSSGPSGFPTIIMRPKEKWWSDEVLDAQQRPVFKQAGLRIYKARWMVTNSFSYPKGDKLRLCK